MLTQFHSFKRLRYKNAVKFYSIPLSKSGGKKKTKRLRMHVLRNAQPTPSIKQQVQAHAHDD